MYYGYFLDGEIVAPVPMCSRFDNIGAWHTLSDEERAEHGWYPCDILDEQKDQRLHTQVLESKALRDGRIVLTYTYVPRGLYTVIEERLELLTALYNEAKQQQIVLHHDTYKVLDAKAISEACESFAGADVYIDLGLVRKLPRAMAEAILSALRQREQQLLIGRYEVQEKIKNSISPDEVLQVDIQAGINKYLE